MAILGGLYGAQQEATKTVEAQPRNRVATFEVQKAANGYVIHANGAMYIAKTADDIKEQVISILVACNIK